MSYISNNTDYYGIREVGYAPSLTSYSTTLNKMTDELVTDIKKEEPKKEIKPKSFMPTKYIINDNATILYFEDGSKTVVKKCEDDEFNARLGFLTAFFQHYCGMTKNKANKYLANLSKEKKKDKKLAKVLSLGFVYSNYSTFVEKFYPDYLKHFVMGDLPDLDKKYKVIKEDVSFKEYHKCLIQDRETNQVYLMDYIGILEEK